MTELSRISKLLGDTSRILDHQKEISILRGENFNIFSILKMESKENATHSAFLGELLNPQGSHNMGNIFLKFFLEVVELEHIDLESAKVKLEHNLGERDDKGKTGGRVDIFIWDRFNKSICIENKIYAPDQNVQVQRYFNYNKDNNEVYYLTLTGEEPGPESKGKLRSGEHFHLLSYSSDIVNWLTKCAKEASNYPILRENIQQYVILIKKLTNQLSDSKMQMQIQDLIALNYSSSKTIESNVKLVELEYTRKFLSEMKIELENDLKEGWNVEADHDLEEAWSGLRVRHKEWPERVYVKLEGQSKVPWNDSIYGIIGNKDICNREILNKELDEIQLLKDGFKSNNVWPFYRTVLYFGYNEARAALFYTEKRKVVMEGLAQEILELCKLCEQPLKKVRLRNMKETAAEFQEQN